VKVCGPKRNTLDLGGAAVGGRTQVTFFSNATTGVTAFTARSYPAADTDCAQAALAAPPAATLFLGNTSLVCQRVPNSGPLRGIYLQDAYVTVAYTTVLTLPPAVPGSATGAALHSGAPFVYNSLAACLARSGAQLMYGAIAPTASVCAPLSPLPR